MSSKSRLKKPYISVWDTKNGYLVNYHPDFDSFQKARNRMESKDYEWKRIASFPGDIDTFTRLENYLEGRPYDSTLNRKELERELEI